MEALHSRRTYDYRIQEAICESGDRDTRRLRLLLPELKIPRSTIRSWIHRGTTDVVSCDFAGGEPAESIAEIERLRRRTALLGAVVQLNDCPEHTIVVADSGSENVNGAVDDLLDDEELTRVLAQVEVTFSNSMIEAFWRSLKHSWLYFHPLDSFAARKTAREKRMKENRAAGCGVSVGETSSGALLLQRPRSRMF
jgi:hypothetical protein